MKLLVFLFIIFFCNDAIAKELHGKIINENGTGLSSVMVKNLNTGIATASDSGGYFAIEVTTGDRVSLSHLAYQTYYFTAGDEQFKEIKLSNKNVQLGEVKILSPMAKFRRDSAFNHQVYHKELGYATSKTQKHLLIGTGTVGISVDGFFSELALRASGKKKRFKNFAAVMAADERQRYIGIRYNAALVIQVTGLTDSMAINFVNTHPMSYDFARAASDLELKSWILHEYKARRGG
jgi:hypothetical protein